MMEVNGTTAPRKCVHSQKDDIAVHFRSLGATSVPDSHRDAERIRQEIEAAEARIVEATNAKNSVALTELLSPDIMINSPANKIIDRNEMIEMTVKGEMMYARYENVTEGFSLYGPDLAVLMGREAFVHANPQFGDKEVNRRYTDVWQRSGNSWVQIARQATYTPEEAKNS